MTDVFQRMRQHIMIADKITDFNAKCPNYKISNIVSSTIQCGNVIDNGLPAKPVEDGTNFGCSN